MSLIELAVVMAVLAILAAVLTPVVTQHVEEARSARALAEARTIAQAILLHERDTGRFPVYANVTTPSTNIEILFGPGLSPVFSGGDNWLDGFTPVAALQTRLNTNYFGLPTTLGNGRIMYRGPYTVGIGPDPWGRRYLAEVGPAPASFYAAFVMSAGPDGIVQTVRRQAISDFAVGGDDIVARIQ